MDRTIMQQTTQDRSYNAGQLKAIKRKQLAIASLSQSTPISMLATENKVSRKFVYQQQEKALKAFNGAFEEADIKSERVLFYLPVTFSWLCQLILCFVLHCRASHRGIQKLIRDAFDHDISYGSIHNIVTSAKVGAKSLNEKQDLKNIRLAAEERRDFDTWGTRLLDLKEEGFNPERVFGDDASAIQSAHSYVYPGVRYDIDNAHIIRDMMEVRRYYRNSLKSAITNKRTLEGKVAKTLLNEKMETYQNQLEHAILKHAEAKDLSTSIDTLVVWMQHDVLNMPGLPPVARAELFDFVLSELEALTTKYPHRIRAICPTLKNQKPFPLAFTDVLDKKFQEISEEFVFPLAKIWEMCRLQRCQYGSDRYSVRSIPLYDYFGLEFDGVEEAVAKAWKQLSAQALWLRTYILV